MPYLFDEAVNTHETGTPLMRPVFLEYTGDRNTYYLEHEYMLGSKLLVAPIFNAEGTVKYYLPEGKWTNVLTEQSYDVTNGAWISEQYDNLTLPLLARENSILLRNPNAEHAEYDYTDSPDIHIYELTDGGETSTRVVDEKGAHAGSVSATRTGSTVTLKASGLKGTSKVFVHENGEVKDFTLNGSSAELNL